MNRGSHSRITNHHPFSSPRPILFSAKSHAKVSTREAFLLLLVLLCAGSIILLSSFALSRDEPSSLRGTGAESWSAAEHLNGHLAAILPQATHLVLVAGHAVYIGSDLTDYASSSSWYLEDYQRVPGQVETFLEHMRVGIELVANNSRALLLFSGGATRDEAGPLSEGVSYYLVSRAAAWFDRDVKGRVYVEEHARDSFENLLFSVCRFKELTGNYPTEITIVSYEFKRERFEKLHRAAIAFPGGNARFHFVGTPAPDATAAAAVRGEKDTINAWMQDPYGCEGELLRKKMARNPFSSSIPYAETCEELAGLMGYCGRNVYSGALPWRETRGGVGARRFGSG